MAKGKKEEVEVVESAKVEKVSTAIYSKDKLMKAKKFESFKDVVSCVVGDDEKVTLAEVEKRVDEFLKKEVK